MLPTAQPKPRRQASVKAWRAADIVNQHKLKDAFPEYWAEYREMAALLAAKKT